MLTRASIVLAASAACTGHGAYPGDKSTVPGHAAKHGVESAGLPYHVLDRAGHQLDEQAFWDRLASARVVCVGEDHTNPHHHWVQLQVVRRLGKQWPHLALGMEMFQRPFQGVLDDYAAHRIDDAALRSRSGWEDRWGYDFNWYRPIIEAALDVHGALVALNAAKELTKQVVHHGLESLPPDERAQVPELDLTDQAHRAWFDALMEGMGGSEAHGKKPQSEPADQKAPEGGTDGAAPEMPSADRVYLVQVIWDETMADTAAKWLASHADSRVVLLAGNGHCHDSAIVNRLKRRGVKDVVSVRTVIDDGEGSVAEVLAKPMNDFVVVLDLPADVKAKMHEESRGE
jgi:uncharacterized iron-regulated protein